jgi:hypothetical protein
MEQKFTIRPMEEKDISQIFILHIPAELCPRRVLTLKDIRRMLRDTLDFDGYNYFVAEYKGILVGSFGITKDAMNNRQDMRRPIVRDILVEKDFQDSFVEREMLEFVLLQCRLSGFNNFYRLAGEQSSQVWSTAERSNKRSAMAECRTLPENSCHCLSN